MILFEEGALALAEESAAIDFVRDAFGNLKAIAADTGGQVLLRFANIRQDVSVVDPHVQGPVIAAAKTRRWEREKAIQSLA